MLFRYKYIDHNNNLWLTTSGTGTSINNSLLFRPMRLHDSLLFRRQSIRRAATERVNIVDFYMYLLHERLFFAVLASPDYGLTTPSEITTSKSKTTAIIVYKYIVTQTRVGHLNC